MRVREAGWDRAPGRVVPLSGLHGHRFAGLASPRTALYPADMESGIRSPAERLRLAFDLFDAGVSLMKQRLRRERSSATEDEIERAVETWLRSVDDGDLEGKERS